MPITDALAAAWANTLRGTAFGTQTYVSLHTADPGATGASEVTGGTYARQLAAFNVANDATAQTPVSQDFSGVPAGTIKGIGLWTALTGGTCLWTGRITDTVVPSNSVFRVPAGLLDIKVAAGRAIRSNPPPPDTPGAALRISPRALAIPVVAAGAANAQVRMMTNANAGTGGFVAGKDYVVLLPGQSWVQDTGGGGSRVWSNNQQTGPIVRKGGVVMNVAGARNLFIRGGHVSQNRDWAEETYPGYIGAGWKTDDGLLPHKLDGTPCAPTDPACFNNPVKISTVRGDWYDQMHRGWYVKEFTGEVFLEGLLFDGAQDYETLNFHPRSVGGPDTRVVIQNCILPRVHMQTLVGKNAAGAWVFPFHPHGGVAKGDDHDGGDEKQDFGGGPKRRHLDRVTLGGSEFQNFYDFMGGGGSDGGPFVQPVSEADGTKALSFSRLNVKNQTGYHVWDHQNQSTTPVSFDQVFVQRGVGAPTLASMFTSKVLVNAATTATGHTDTAAGPLNGRAYVSYDNNANAVGRIYDGDPPTGDFVQVGRDVFQNNGAYTSPGYQ